jgi:hypothetical protein
MKYVEKCHFDWVLLTVKDVMNGKRCIQVLKRMIDYYENHPIEATEFIKKDFTVTGYEKEPEAE